MIRDYDVEVAHQFVIRTDVADDMRRILSKDGRGVPSRLTVEACLTGCVLTLQHKPALTYANVHRVLTEDISHDWQHKLGTRYREQKGHLSVERAITRRPIENMLNRIGDALGYLPGSYPELTDPQRSERRELLQSFMDRLIDASKPRDLAATAELALDATGVWSWGRSRDELADRTDKDAEWGYKTAKDGEKEMFYGYDVYAFVRVQTFGVDDRYPHVVERLVVRPAASDEPDSTLPMIRSMTTGPYPIRTLLVDRAWSYKVPERWVYPLRELGIEQIVDLHKNDHGVTDHQGMRVVAGWPHCPSLPDRLVDLRRPPKLKLPDGSTIDDLPETAEDDSATQAATRAFVEQINERRTYAARRLAGPFPDGRERYECPAAAGQCRCPLKPMSMYLPADQVLTIQDPPAEDVAPRICTQRTITLPGTVTPKVRQRLYWGSVEWIRSFARRTHVEGAFGNIKNRNTENISRGWLQVTGLARNSLMLALAAAVYNMRVSRVWNGDNELSDDPLLGTPPPYHGWRELTAEEAEAYGDDEQAA